MVLQPRVFFANHRGLSCCRRISFEVITTCPASFTKDHDLAFAGVIGLMSNWLRNPRGLGDRGRLWSWIWRSQPRLYVRLLVAMLRGRLAFVGRGRDAASHRVEGGFMLVFTTLVGGYRGGHHEVSWGWHLHGVLTHPGVTQNVF